MKINAEKYTGKLINVTKNDIRMRRGFEQAMLY